MLEIKIRVKFERSRSSLDSEAKVIAGMGHHAAAPNWRFARLTLGVVQNELAESPYKLRNLLLDSIIDQLPFCIEH